MKKSKGRRTFSAIEFIANSRYVVLAVLGMSIMTAIVFMLNPSSYKSQSELGVLAVKSMYDFGNIVELDDKMDVLKTITTEEVYNDLTIDKTDRTLSVYLKFNNKPSRVIIEKATDKYILYRLDTESIASTRTFIFTYNVGRDGKIDYVREGEFVDLSSNL